jgi:protein O-GlcNAc transferase
VLDYVTGRGFGMHPFSQDRYGAVEAGQNYLLDLRQEELARQCFLRAVQLDPDNARAWTYLGNIAYARNKPSQALAAWRHALRLQPGRTKVHAAIAHTLLEQGDKNGARQEWQQIVKLAPDSADGRRAADALASTK